MTRFRDAERINIMLPIRYHLPIMIVCEFVGFLVGAISVGTLWASGMIGSSLWIVAPMLFVGVLVGTLFPRFIFRSLWPARCDQAECQGSALPVSVDPITYQCRKCGHKTVTGVSDGDGRNSPFHHRH